MSKTATARPRRKSPQAGFLLLEVVVALLIAVLVLAVLVHGSAESSRAVRTGLDMQEAIVRARSRLAVLDHGGLLPGRHSGDDGGGFTWRTAIAPIATTVVTRDHAEQYPDSLMPRQTLYAVTVTVEW